MADLTTLDNAKAYLGLGADQTADDVLLTRLVTAASKFVSGEIGRTIPAELITETQSGKNYGTSIFPKRFPVLSVTSVTIDGAVIPARSVVGGDGWVFADDEITLVGYTTTPGASNVSIVYTAGFAVEDEAGTVSADPYTVQAAEFFAGDLGVTYADGTAMVKVTGTPTVGQYAVSSTGLYTFAADDEGEGVLLTYGTVPEDIQQAVIELVAYRYKAKDRISIANKTLPQGEAISFVGYSASTTSVDAVIDHYHRPEVA